MNRFQLVKEKGIWRLGQLNYNNKAQGLALAINPLSRAIVMGTFENDFRHGLAVTNCKAHPDYPKKECFLISTEGLNVSAHTFKIYVLNDFIEVVLHKNGHLREDETHRIKITDKDWCIKKPGPNNTKQTFKYSIKKVGRGTKRYISWDVGNEKKTKLLSDVVFDPIVGMYSVPKIPTDIDFNIKTNSIIPNGVTGPFISEDDGIVYMGFHSEYGLNGILCQIQEDMNNDPFLHVLETKNDINKGLSILVYELTQNIYISKYIEGVAIGKTMIIDSQKRSFMYRSYCYEDQDICDLLLISLDFSEIKIYYGLNIKTNKCDDVMTL